MTYNKLFLLLPAIALLSSTACTSAKKLASERTAIRQICEKQVDSWRMQSYEGESQVWAHKGDVLKMLTSGKRDIGWEKIGGDYRKYLTGMEGEPEFETILSDFYIYVNKKNAWVVFDQHQVFANSMGNEQLYETLEFRCLEKINGEWKITMQLTGPYDTRNEEQNVSANTK